MKTIEAYCWKLQDGSDWRPYMKVNDNRINRTLKNLRKTNPDIQFRVAEVETEQEYQQHQRHADLVHRGLAAA